MRMWLILLAILISYSFIGSGQKPSLTSDLYGKYHISVTNFTQCAGAKKPGAVLVNATWVKNKDGTDDIFMSADVKKPVGPLGSRMKVYKYTNGIPKMTLEYRIKNMCKHFLGQEALNYMPKTDSRCYLLKGPVQYQMLDYDNLMHTYFGEKFFYGKFLFMVDYSSAIDEIVCNKLYVEIVPVE